MGERDLDGAQHVRTMEFYHIDTAETENEVIHPCGISWGEALAIWTGIPEELVPASVRVERAGVHSDFVQGHAYHVLRYASKRLVKVIEQFGLTGVRFTPAVDANTTDHTDYAVVTVVGRCGDLDDSHEGLKKSRFTTGLVEIVGVWFDVRTWDGSDFFLAQNYWGLFCTRRVVDVFEQVKVTGWEATPLAVFRRVCPG